jgi:hypothetical protein
MTMDRHWLRGRYVCGPRVSPVDCRSVRSWVSLPRLGGGIRFARDNKKSRVTFRSDPGDDGNVRPVDEDGHLFLPCVCLSQDL